MAVQDGVLLSEESKGVNVWIFVWAGNSLLIDFVIHPSGIPGRGFIIRRRHSDSYIPAHINYPHPVFTVYRMGRAFIHSHCVERTAGEILYVLIVTHYLH